VFNYAKCHYEDMPEITVYINCDTRLAINLSVFDLGEDDEFIFVIKNYNYIDSAPVFLFRARKTDLDDNGEVIFKITPEASKSLKPGAFYNFAVRVNAFNDKEETEYKKITGNGKVLIEYGAQDLDLETGDTDVNTEIIGVRFELTDNIDEEI
jgi:hypothetical protein